VAGSGTFGIPASSPWAPSLLKPATGLGKAGASPQMAALLKNYPQIRDDLEKNPRVLQLLAQMARGGNTEKPLEELRGILVGYLGKRKMAAADLAENIKEKQAAIASLEKSWADLKTGLIGRWGDNPNTDCILMRGTYVEHFKYDWTAAKWVTDYCDSYSYNTNGLAPIISEDFIEAADSVDQSDAQDIANAGSSITDLYDGWGIGPKTHGRAMNYFRTCLGHDEVKEIDTEDGDMNPFTHEKDWNVTIKTKKSHIDAFDAKIHAICEKARTDLDILNHEFKGEMSRTNSARSELRDLSRDIVSLAKPS